MFYIELIILLRQLHYKHDTNSYLFAPCLIHDLSQYLRKKLSMCKPSLAEKSPSPPPKEKNLFKSLKPKDHLQRKMVYNKVSGSFWLLSKSLSNFPCCMTIYFKTLKTKIPISILISTASSHCTEKQWGRSYQLSMRSEKNDRTKKPRR